MKALLISLAFFVGQMITMQDKPVVHLKPHKDTIEVSFAGSILELQDAPQYLHLPEYPPKPDAQGNQWAVDIKNFGPRAVTIVDKEHFSTTIHLNQTVHIYSNGTAYFLKR
jgi:hypothetical protein